MSMLEPEYAAPICTTDVSVHSTPFSIRIAGLLCIATGVSSIIGMIGQFASGKFFLDFGFVFIVLGWGLLAGRSSSRIWLIFLFGCGAALCTGLALWLAFEYFQSSPRDAAVIRIRIANLVVSGCLATFVVATLLRADIRSWFSTPRVAPALGASWSLPATLAFAVVLGQQSVRDWQPPPERPFPIFTTVAVRDAETGESIDSISFLPKQSKDSSRNTFSSSLSVSIRGSGADGTQLAFKGIATEPVEITLAAKGYSPRTVHLTESSPETLTVDLTREP